jgi:4-amino-4-deoxy-L-arabinose transferase-like glycosyltransferase
VATFSVLTISATLICYTLPSVMTESFLLLGMTMISCSFWLQINSDKIKNFYGYCFFIGSAIAMLTKGFVGIAFPGLAIFIYLLISKRWREFFQKFPIIVGATIFIGLSLPWFILAEKGYPGFLEYFISYPLAFSSKQRILIESMSKQCSFPIETIFLP